MTDDIFSKRGRALEEAFFVQRDQELLDQLRAHEVGQQIKSRLAEVSGIREDAILEKLISAGVRPATFAALSLAPLVLVAWADDFLQVGERKRILKAAENEGIEPGNPAYQLLESWMKEKPDDQILTCWKAYIAALSRTYAPQSMEELRERILGRARRIAKAAGGIFGLASINHTEKTILAEMDSAFKTDQ